LDKLSERNRTEWELRSHLFGASLRSVLFKGLPDAINEHLHNWQKGIILKLIEGKDGLKILDVGCGYGRLSIPIIEKFPGVDIRGVDISENYVRLYKENTNHLAFIGTIENLPAELGTFDYIICITVLMYLDHENLEKAVFNLILHLKPGGRLILIEPYCSGRWFQTGFGMVPFLMKRIRRNTINTGGRSFRVNEIECSVSHAGGKILSDNRLPVTSLCLLPMTLCAIMLPNRIAKGIFKIVSRLDALLGVFKFPSIYVAYAITKNE
jgi:2-polyprenyl-3-methyl-5-hydroxy-6-metoxy-1,4-benzoquinol methylase